MHLCDLTALPVGLMLFFSFLFQRMRAAPPVLPRLARHAGDHEARSSRVAVECQAVGIDEARNPFATWYAKTAKRRFSAPETAAIQRGPSGSAGIGTASPAAMVDINQTGGGSGTSTALALRAGNTNIYTGNNQIVLGYSASQTYQHAIKTRHNSGAAAGNDIDFYLWRYGTDAAGAVGTKQVMTLDGTGNVGIGVTAPSDILDVNGAIGITTTTSALPVNGIYSSAANQLAFTTSSSTAVTITSVGAVGIGTTAPGQSLEVQTNSSGSLTFPVKATNNGNSTSSAGMLFQIDSGGSGRGKGALIYTGNGTGWNRGDFQFLQNSAGDTTNPTTANAVMTIQNGGNVGVSLYVSTLRARSIGRGGGVSIARYAGGGKAAQWSSEFVKHGGGEGHSPGFG